VTRREFAVAGLTGLSAAQSFSQQDEKPIRVRVSLGDVSLNKVSFLIADDTGIYRKHGLDVQQLITPSAAAAVRGSGVTVPERYVASPNDRSPAEFSIGGGAPTIVGMVSGNRPLDRVILATTDSEVRWKIVGRAGVVKLDDLKGKRLSYSGRGTVSHFMALAFARQIGWQPDRDILLVANGISIATLKEGRADAIIADEIVQALAPASGFPAIVDLRSYHIPLPGSGVIASKSWLANNREAARRFMRATVESIAAMKQHSEIASAAMAKWFAITDPVEQRRIWNESTDLPPKPYPSRAGIVRLMELYDSPEMAKHKPEDFYDDSFVRELDQSGFIDSLYHPKSG
jgi:ABC-type nitrate/sulfonate/bicarbonate transport system substrate-binding protein